MQSARIRQEAERFLISQQDEAKRQALEYVTKVKQEMAQQEIAAAQREKMLFEERRIQFEENSGKAELERQKANHAEMSNAHSQSAETEYLIFVQKSNN